MKRLSTGMVNKWRAVISVTSPVPAAVLYHSVASLTDDVMRHRVSLP